MTLDLFRPLGIRLIAACMLLLWLGGCAKVGPIRESAALNQVLAAYRDASAQTAKAGELPLIAAEAGVKLERGEHGVVLVSVGETHRNVDRLVTDILNLAGIPVVFLDDHPMAISVAAFERRPLPEAITALLASDGLTGEINGQIALIRRASQDSARTPRPVMLSIPLSHARVDVLKAMMAELYPAGDKPPAVTLSAQPSSNSLILQGEVNALIAQARVVKQLDQPIPHVLIETLMVTLESTHLESFNNQIANFQKGKFGSVSTAIGESAGPTLSLGYSAASSNATAFTAYIDMLVSNQEARVIARPYVATVSGNAASINLTNQRFVLAQLTNSSVTTATQVNSGVMLSILPTVLPGNRINMHIEVEESAFIPTEGNVAVEVSANKASTTMITGDGKTIVIGGLKSNRATGDRMGVPHLRDVPLLEYLSGTRSVTNDNLEVVIMVTPHVWKPGMDTPLVANDALWVPNKPPN
jgi:general secretion pathway protein D